MFKAWIKMWKNTFNYSGNVTRKEYWLACIMNVIAMYVLVIPYALILRFLSVSPIYASEVFIIAMHLPVLAMYFRRAKDAAWKKSTAIFMMFSTPVISGVIVGLFSSVPEGAVYPRFYTVCAKLFALSFGLFFYGVLGGIIFFGSPEALGFLPIAGLILGTVTMVGGYIKDKLEK